MPIYEYRRPDGTTFEVMQSFSEDALTHDPETGVEVRRVMHAPAVHFKGSGFYNTDYGTRRRQRENAAGEGGGESSVGESSGKGEGGKGEGSGKGEGGKGEGSGKDGGASSKDSGGSAKDGGSKNGGNSKDSAAKSSSSGGRAKSEAVGA